MLLPWCWSSEASRCFSVIDFVRFLSPHLFSSVNEGVLFNVFLGPLQSLVGAREHLSQCKHLRQPSRHGRATSSQGVKNRRRRNGIWWLDSPWSLLVLLAGLCFPPRISISMIELGILDYEYEYESVRQSDDKS